MYVWVVCYWFICYTDYRNKSFNFKLYCGPDNNCFYYNIISLSNTLMCILSS